MWLGFWLIKAQLINPSWDSATSRQSMEHDARRIWHSTFGVFMHRASRSILCHHEWPSSYYMLACASSLDYLQVCMYYTWNKFLWIFIQPFSFLTFKNVSVLGQKYRQKEPTLYHIRSQVNSHIWHCADHKDRHTISDHLDFSAAHLVMSWQVVTNNVSITKKLKRMFGIRWWAQ